MSKYTTELRYICETFAGLDKSVGYDDINKVITPDVRKKIFGDYAFYDEAKREEFERIIITHFYTREIAYETVGRWRLAVNSKMREIMPMYNAMFKTTEKMYNIDAFADSDYTETEHGTSVDDGETKGSGSDTTENTNRRLYAETPMGEVDFPNIDSNTPTHLTNLTKDITNGKVTLGTKTEVDNTKITDRTVTVKGKRGGFSYGHLYKEYMEEIKNIMSLVIDELEELFFALY